MHIIYRIGDAGTVYSAFTSFPGCFFTVLPLLAVVFTVMKKKIPAVIFAVLNLLFSALIIVLSVVYNGEAKASWIAYAVASVVLMLFALRVIRRKTLTGRLCFSLGIVAAVVSVMLSADIDSRARRFCIPRTTTRHTSSRCTRSWAMSPTKTTWTDFN